MPRQFECYTYTPDTKPTSCKSAEAANTLPLDFAVLMGTPVSSMVKDAKGQDGNVGAHAEALANRLGTRVLAYQDLGPKVSFPDLRSARHRMLPRNFQEYTAEITDTLAEYIAAESIGKLALRVHSGNGPLGTELALNLNQAAELRVTHAAISDPAGLKAVSSFWAGFKLWRDYRRTHEKLMPAEQRADPGQPPNTLTAFIKDVYVRSNIWRTDAAFTNITAIREETDIATLLYLPGKTFNGDLDAMQALADYWPDRKAGKPFRIEFAPEGYHGTTYDSFAGNEAFMRRTLGLTSI